MAQETVQVTKLNEAGELQTAYPLKSDLETWLSEGWALVETKPAKGDTK
jgi:hypothetical protein